MFNLRTVRSTLSPEQINNGKLIASWTQRHGQHHILHWRTRYGSGAVALVLLNFICTPVAVAQIQSAETNSREVNSSLERPGLPPASVTNPSTYRLGPGDQLQISVYGYDELTADKVVLPDGTIKLSLIGTVTADGQTLDQLEQEITQRLKSYLVNPVVTLSLTTLRPVEVNVAGEVMRPGPVRGDKFEGNPTLSEALLAAGGITQNANIRRVELRRYTPNGEAEPIVVDLWQAISSEQTASDPVLQGGDSIYVPRLTASESLDRRLIARASFAPETVRVRVVGEVEKPGEVAVSPNSSLSSAVAIAGGPTQDASLGHVAFIRLNETGQIERQSVDLRSLTDSYQVQDGDVIIVPKSTASNIVDVAGRILSPLGALMNLFLGVDRLGR